jgi:quinol monooxygenase YgiN
MMRIQIAAPVLLSIAGVVPLSAQARYDRIPAGAYSITAEMQAKPGKTDELRAISVPLIDSVRSDPKNLIYFLQEDRSTPGRFVFFEVFATEADFEAHNNMPYVKAFLARLPDLSEGGVRVTRMKVLAK